MGMFDTMYSADRSVGVQTKMGSCFLAEYVVGDYVAREFPNGIYEGNFGYFVIDRGILVSVTKDYPSGFSHVSNMQAIEQDLRGWAYKVIEEINSQGSNASEEMQDLCWQGHQILERG